MSTAESGESGRSGVNPCLDLCKKSSCCRNTRFFFLNPDEFLTLTQNETYIVKLDSYMDMPKDKELKYLNKGVYYANNFDSNGITAVIVGPCANLDENGACTIYETRPNPCRKFAVGGEACKRFRKRDGLAPIQELIQLSPKK